MKLGFKDLFHILTLFFSNRTIERNGYLFNRISNFLKKYDTTIKFESLNLSFSSVNIKFLYIHSSKFNIDFHFEDVIIKFRLLKFLRRNQLLPFLHFQIKSITVQIFGVREKGIRPSDSIIESSFCTKFTYYAEKVKRHLRTSALPGLYVDNCTITYPNIAPYKLKDVKLLNNTFSVSLLDRLGNIKNILRLTIDRKIEQICGTISKCDVCHSKTMLECNDIKFIFEYAGEKTFKYMMHLSELTIFSPAISSFKIDIPTLELVLGISYKDDSIVFTNESGGSIDNIPFATRLKYSAVDKNLIRLSLIVEITQDFFSFGSKYFTNNFIRKSQWDGKLIFGINLILNYQDIYSHYFDIKIIENTLNISNLALLEEIRFHQAIKNIPQGDCAKIKTRQEEPVFPQLLLDTIIVTEDPNFRNHHGIDIRSIGKAIVCNLATRKITMGGSTITMQLTRNIYLNHDRNLLRKVEEIILSLILENVLYVSKDEILLTYIKIIEFGPNVYGIENAAKLYFNKQVIALTLEEIITITYIIPRPIHFFDALETKSQQLEINLKRYILLVKSNLIGKGIIPSKHIGTKSAKSITFPNWNYNILL